MYNIILCMTFLIFFCKKGILLAFQQNKSRQLSKLINKSHQETNMTSQSVIVLVATVILILMMQPSLALLSQLPGLYIDQIDVRNVNGTEMAPVTSGYNFSINWRQTLPAIINSGLNLINFQTGQQSYLSYRTLNFFNTSSGIVNLNLVGQASSIMFMSFTVIILTQNNSNVYFESYQDNSNILLSSRYEYFLVYHNISSYSYNTFSVYRFFEWFTGTDTPSESFYSIQITTTTVYTDRIFFQVVQTYYPCSGFRINFILIRKRAAGINIAVHYNYSTQGGQKNPTFDYNFGINTTNFGMAGSSYCLYGFGFISLYSRQPTSTKYSSYIFQYNGTQILGISINYVRYTQQISACFGSCPRYQYFDSVSCVNCSTLTYCLDCSSASQCVSCISGGFVLSNNKKYCQCPVRTLINTTTLNCDPCPYDCYTCDYSGFCLTCDSAENRQLNFTTNRCGPKTGYYQTNTSLMDKCSSGCAQCSSKFNCSLCNEGYLQNNFCKYSCSSRYYQNNIAKKCQACPFDCYTCDETGRCLSCSNADNRELNGSRCIPKAEYYETNASIAESCLSTCLNCTSKSNCQLCYSRYFNHNGSCVSSCPSGTYPNNLICSPCPSNCQSCSSETVCTCPYRNFYNYSSSQCQACPFDCYTCDETGRCLSCSNADNRELNGSRCIPKAEYFESNMTKATSCSQDTKCALSACKIYCPNLPITCPTGQFYYAPSSSCVLDCPQRYYQYYNVICYICRYDCLTCSSNFSCSTCDAQVDNRFLDNTTKSCSPLPGYYQSNTTVASPCSTGCSSCTNENNCQSCQEGYNMDNNQCVGGGGGISIIIIIAIVAGGVVLLIACCFLLCRGCK